MQCEIFCSYQVTGNQYIFYFFQNANLNFCLDEFQTSCLKSRELQGTAILKILIASCLQRGER